MARKPRNSITTLKDAVRTAFRSVLLVCVFASLWRAPIPWLHHHDTPVTGEFSDQLSRHLNAWHHGSLENPAGWHLHFAMLDDILRGGGCPVPADGNEDELPVTVEFAEPSVVNAVSVELLLLSVNLLTVWSDGPLESLSAFRRSDLRKRGVDEKVEPRRLLTLLSVSRC